MAKTVNQLLDILISNYAFDDIRKNRELKKIHTKLTEIKFRYSNGGIVGIKNADDLVNRILKYKLAV
jgi:hypothetical protein